ncbi:uncharacterized protein LOC113863850 [Abrus precatorius]|uniref:Uncharacterized protein LOC113863850 n=1 Tax=Abrus precatorius TaxID=3816 RepID=A0A8B8LAZ4_ABRPR|nr:uncharacterized protein LOC113863850 [Abrus precatorius]
MGNQISFRGSDGTGKIVYWDGSVQQFDEPLTVAELMLEHPQQVVVEFHSAVNQKRPTPLPADKKLEMKKTYVMLPVKPGKPVGLSSEDSRRMILIVDSALHSNYLMRSSGFLPWFARLFHPGNASIGDAAMLKVENVEERYGFSELLQETIEGRPEYMSRQLSGKGWKPSLDTIKEKKVKRKMLRWLFLKSFSGSEI